MQVANAPYRVSNLIARMIRAAINKKKTEAVDAMHISHPLRFGPVRIGLAQVQVFGHLFQHSHDVVYALPNGPKRQVLKWFIIYRRRCGPGRKAG